jgi:hypothetical protein
MPIADERIIHAECHASFLPKSFRLSGSPEIWLLTPANPQATSGCRDKRFVFQVAVIDNAGKFDLIGATPR